MQLEIGLRSVVKTLVAVILVLLFYVYFYRPVISQFKAELVNTSTYEEKVSEQAFPTITICVEKMFKTQFIQDKYNSSWYALFYGTDYLDPAREIGYAEMWNDAIYKLKQDYDVILRSNTDSSLSVDLDYGLNHVDFANGDVLVKKIGGWFGACTVIEPIDLMMKPTEGFYVEIYINQNSSYAEDIPQKLTAQFSNWPLFYLDKTFGGLPGVKVHSMDLDSSEYALATVYYDETFQTYVKGCSDEQSVYQDMARRIVENQHEFDCPKVCVSPSIRSIMDTIEHDMDICKTFEENICMEGQMSVASTHSLDSIKSCTVMAPIIVIPSLNPIDDNTLPGLFTLFVTVGAKRVVKTEYFIYDTLGLIGNIGGTLGLFIGFSFYDSIASILDFVFGQFQLDRVIWNGKRPRRASQKSPIQSVLPKL